MNELFPMPGAIKICLLAWAVALLAGTMAATEEPQLREKVAVVNVEIPVRVFLDGLPLADLPKGDFRLFEDNEPQLINGFYQRRKKLHVQRVQLVAEAESSSLPPRYFVLCFRMVDFTDQLRQGLDYFFKQILREQDQLLVFVNERTLLLNQDIWQVRRREILEQVLGEEALKARQEMESYFLRVRQDIDQAQLRQLVERSRESFTIPQIIGFLQKYLSVWQEFKKKYLIPDLDKFYNFARHLEKIKAEKWVLSFYQIEMFPKMKIDGSTRRRIEGLMEEMTSLGGAAEQFAKVIGRSLEAIDRDMNTAGEFPVEQIAKMLIRVDTTYHCFISSVGHDGQSEDLQFSKVASELENTLREIAMSSGGGVTFSRDIGSALHAIEEKEDVYYVLTYEPKNQERRGKIRIELTHPRCRLFYDDQVRSNYIAEYLKEKKTADPTLQLDRIFLSGRQLQLDISSFKIADAKAGKNGRLRVAIRIHDDQNRQLYDQGRSFVAHESQVKMAVDFPFLKPGRYMFLVEVHDQLTGKTAMDILQADVH